MRGHASASMPAMRPRFRNCSPSRGYDWSDRGLPVQCRIQRQQAAARDHRKSCSSRPGNWPAYAGFLVGREAAKHMLTRGRGTMLFTGATASVRASKGFAAFSSAKFGLRAVAQSMARELGPEEYSCGPPADRRRRRQRSDPPAHEGGLRGRRQGIFRPTA